MTRRRGRRATGGRCFSGSAPRCRQTPPRSCRAPGEMRLPRCRCRRAWDTLKACGEIDAIAENVLAIDQYVTEMDADAPLHSAFAGNPSITLGHQLLER